MYVTESIVKWYKCMKRWKFNQSNGNYNFKKGNSRNIISENFWILDWHNCRKKKKRISLLEDSQNKLFKLKKMKNPESK